MQNAYDDGIFRKNKFVIQIELREHVKNLPVDVKFC